MRPAQENPHPTLSITAAHSALRAWGAPDGPLTLIRHSVNDLYHHPRTNLAIRVSGPGVDPRPGLTIATRAATLGLRALPAHPNHPPIHTHDRWVTAATWHPQPQASTPNWAWLGTTLRHIHHHGPDLTNSLILPDYTDNVLTWFTSRTTDRLNTLNTTGHLPQTDIDLLTETAHTAVQNATRQPPGERTLLHGDLHPGNILHTTQGAVLIDWDGAAHGPWWFDHLPTAVQTRAFGHHDAHDTFTRAYRRDPRTTPAFNHYVTIKMLSSTIWLATVLPNRPELTTEYQARMNTWRTGHTTPWTVV